ncbi:MAG TPA: flagellar basal body P-ring formation chaperone FlgA [Acetobacteraceae bacterium]|nr:flagellar basal body P-ring formation chaperone FlgA [Acetobacteraceae bacterium]
MMLQRILFLTICSAALSILSGPSAAKAAREVPADVEAAILAALPKNERDIVQIGPSAAARMTRCLTPLAASVMGQGIYRTVRIDCASPRWSIYVGISLDTMETVLVANKNIPLGKRLTAGDFRQARMTSANVPGERISVRDAIGKQIAAPLTQGDIITSNDVVIPLAVHSGDKIVIYFAGSSMTATAAGTALESGAFGQSILVQNDDSHREVTVKIIASGGPIPSGQLFVIATR